MSKIVTIPTDGMNPFVVTHNGEKYVFTPGETVEVSDGVALEIEEYKRWREKYYGTIDPPYEGGGDIDALIDGSLTEIKSNAESVKPYAFCDHRTITYFDFPKATRICEYAFYNTGIGAVTYTGNFPKVTHIERYAFASETVGQSMHMLEIANFPEVVIIDKYAFYRNTELKQIYFPKVETIGEKAFNTNQGVMLLEAVDLPKVTSLGNYAFARCANLTKLILRSETICAAQNSRILDDCYHFHGTVNATYNPNGLKDGYIYVPRALIDSYKAATNWTTLATQFRALEDYTVDGTTTGELDESKVSL